ncbi:MAG: DUF2807 domain-containing protein [Bacteroidales bacterium]|nr:DUF2807 domain-containing protein [Bacteroidales bacterium]
MKQFSILLLFAGTLTSSVFCQEKKSTEAFEKIVIADGVFAQIVSSSDYSLEIKANNQSQNCLVTTVENGILTLKKRSKSTCTEDIFVSIICPYIKSIEVIGKSELTSKGILRTDSLNINVRNRSKVYIDVEVAYLKAELSEGSILNARGNTEFIKANLVTSAILSTYDLKANDAKIRCTSGAMAKVCVNNTLEAQTIGNSYIGYKCSPEKKIFDTSSGGKIEQVSP